MSEYNPAEKSPASPKQAKTDDMTTQGRLAPVLLVSNADLQSKSSSGNMNISRSPQELSKPSHGTDVRFKLPGAAQPTDASIRSSRHPLLPSSSLESSQCPKEEPVRAADRQYQHRQLRTQESSPDRAQSPPPGKELKCADFLDNIRVTAEERRFLRNMLNSLPAPGDNRAPETRNRSGCESETQQTLFSNHDPFLSEALDLADECFLAL